MKRVAGIIEMIFDILYLSTVAIIGIILIITRSGNTAGIISGIMAIVLAAGDAFHLIPRIMLIITKNREKMRITLGGGKQIASITMTVFYILLWHIGIMLSGAPVNIVWTYIIYLLAAARIALSLAPQNAWYDASGSKRWQIYRNIPFFIIGVMVAALFFVQRSMLPGLQNMWIAILLSFAFYAPVVLWADKQPKLGMLMLPKSCAYVWIVAMFLNI